MNPILQAASKRAGRAAKRGDMRAADEIELDYIKGNVPLYSRRADDVVPGVCTRMCRGAGPAGETLLEWLLPNGKTVYSDMDATVLAEYEDEACGMLVGLHPGRIFELL
ncbi:hypothetical protein [Paraburkholderia fungorum]|uniref:hypothetical protein n=1 Tax=Paraburkholderia fungorum TaxID=134537 RepID=UPI001620BFF2|nr:hypothetical protein [Paraburkholderia fungorum]MBB5543570.1 hypothetical protein [Paraburkholderia fungorum]